MPDPISIIVYHSPDEATLWESGMLFPVIVSAVIAAVLTFLVVKVWESGCNFLNVRGKRHTNNVAMVAAVGIMGYSLRCFSVL